MNVTFTFPNRSYKAISFTIDDGNIPLDKKFLSIVKPAGILGTFNLCANSRRYDITDEDCREMYRGYEIANHCKLHPFALNSDKEYKFSSEPFDAVTSDPEYLYGTDIEGVYMYKYSPRYWSHIATAEAYLALAEQSKRELEQIFGEGSIEAFVWPYGKQNNEAVFEGLVKQGYKSIRKTGCSGFELPSDRMNWSYGANHSNMTERAEEFEALDTDGELRWFCFGVHSHDFENNNCWYVLENFAKKYGNRPEDYWYATVGEIFKYEDATKAAKIEDNRIFNNSDLTLYATVDGECVEIAPHTAFSK